ncbi:hypothetical protein ACEN2I_03455 [Flavobacterium sp. W22_SRS_FK3]
MKKEENMTGKTLSICAKGQMMNIPFTDIIYIESLGNYDETIQP